MAGGCCAAGFRFGLVLGHSRHSRHPAVSGSPQERTFGQFYMGWNAPGVCSARTLLSVKQDGHVHSILVARGRDSARCARGEPQHAGVAR